MVPTDWPSNSLLEVLVWARRLFEAGDTTMEALTFPSTTQLVRLAAEPHNGWATFHAGRHSSGIAQ